MYGATEGEILLSQYNLVNVPNNSIPEESSPYTTCSNACYAATGTYCSGCFIRESGGSHAKIPGVIHMHYMNWLEPDTVVHEMGHGYLSLKDEYGPGNRCGHSLMASQATMPNFCTAHNHNLDRSPGSSALPFGAAWDEATFLVLPPAYTPDVETYEFHGLGNNPSITNY
jgi:hypothetical protein